MAEYHSRAGDRQRLGQSDEKITGLHVSHECGERMGQEGHILRRSIGNIPFGLWKAVSGIALMLLACLAFAGAFQRRSFDSLAASNVSTRSLQHYTRAAASSLQEVFQVYPPVLTMDAEGVLEITDGSSNASVEVVDTDKTTCQQVLTVYSFAYSYGVPYVGEYTPPSCSFNRVSWNLTVQVSGVQYDRLGMVYLGNIEVFRTSTAEPTATGVEWTYIKDMTNYLSLFKTDQKLIFDLDNIVTDVYTGIYNVTLTASYFTAGDSITPADLIIPLSGHNASENASSVIQVPPHKAENSLTLPRNVKKAVFTIAAVGQIDEEFWWSNVLQSEIDTFPQYGELYGYSPFREVQLFIDGMLAGVAWPFPIIFTGGIVPGLWSPIVGIDAFDLKEDEIDITPWLPLLCDGDAHNFTIAISGLNDHGNGTATLSEITDGYWLVTGKVFIWLDEEGHVTTGVGPVQSLPQPTFDVTSYVGATNGTNETLVYTVKAQRSLSFSSKLSLSTGEEEATWSQDLTYSAFGNYSDGGNIEVNTQSTEGYDWSSSGYARQFSYPLYAYTICGYEDDDAILICSANVNRGKEVKTLGQPVFPTGLESFSAVRAVEPEYGRFEGAWLATTQNGSAVYIANYTSDVAESYGTTVQEMTFAGIEVEGTAGSGGFPTISGNDELFYRYAKGVNGTIAADEETLVDTPIGHHNGQGRHGKSGYVVSGLPGRPKNWHGSL